MQPGQDQQQPNWPQQQPPESVPQPVPSSQTPVQPVQEQPVEYQYPAPATYSDNPLMQEEQMPVPEQPQQVVDNEFDGQAIQWQSPEYIEHARVPLWYVGFWVIVVSLVLVAIFVLQSWSFAILVPAMAAALMIYSHRPPRLMSYVLSHKGLYINDQLHAMTEFKSFGVMRQDQLPSLMLVPTKRFKPGLTIYFPAEVGENIVDLLGSRIPMQELHLDAFDKIIRKLRI